MLHRTGMLYSRLFVQIWPAMALFSLEDVTQIVARDVLWCYLVGNVFAMGIQARQGSEVRSSWRSVRFLFSNRCVTNRKNWLGEECRKSKDFILTKYCQYSFFRRFFENEAEGFWVSGRYANTSLLSKQTLEELICLRQALNHGLFEADLDKPRYKTHKTL